MNAGRDSTALGQWKSTKALKWTRTEAIALIDIYQEVIDHTLSRKQRNLVADIVLSLSPDVDIFTFIDVIQNHTELSDFAERLKNHF